MYDKYFGLTDKPFSIAPDPRYLFMSEQHREALAHLVYGVGDGGGFVMLTGEVGTGKTTVCRCLLEQIPDTTRIAFILNPKLSTTELLATVCDELHIEYPEMPSLKELNDVLNEFLLRSHAAGLKIVLMIDEAQNLSTEILEQIRLLTNLETNKEKLLQIILIGQPELKDLLAKHELRQLAQRITARFHLQPLNLEECESYILHRLEVSGFNDSLFDQKAIKELYQRTGGVPRLINVLCDRAMLGAYAKNRRQIGPNVVKQAASEVMGGDEREIQADVIKPSHTPGYFWRMVATGLAIILVAGSTSIIYLFQQQPEPETKLAAGQSSAQLATEIKPEVLEEKQIIIDRQTEQLEQITAENEQLKNTIDDLQSDAVVDNDGDNDAENVVENVKEVTEEVTEEASAAISAEKEQQIALLPFLPTEIQPTSLSLAEQSLLKRWNIEYQPETDGDACNFARNNQLRCENNSGGWWLLRTINRPVILKLNSPTGQSVYGVLISLDATNAVIDFSGKEIVLSRSEVTEYWDGNYTLLWQSPPDYQEPLSETMSGPAVQWLLTSMAKLENLDLIVPPDAVFDSGLKDRVKAFQQQHSLTADGVAGIQTMITLNTLTAGNIPTLTDTVGAI